MDATDLTFSPYTSPAEHLGDVLFRARLLLFRHLRRFWSRIADADGELNDLFVHWDEVRALLPTSQDTPPEDLPTLEYIEKMLAAVERLLLERSRLTLDISLPMEELRAAFQLDATSYDVLIIVAALQLEVQLDRLASFASATFRSERPTVGFLSELVASSPETLLAARACLDADHTLRRLRLLEIVGDPDEPELFLRVKVAQRIAHLIIDRPRYRISSLELPHELSHFLRIAPRAQSLEELGYSRELEAPMRRVFRAAANAQAAYLIGPSELHFGSIVNAALGGRQDVLELLLDRVDVADSELFEATVAVALREATLRNSVLVIHVPEQTRFPWLVSALRALLPHTRNLVCFAMREPSARLAELLGPCPQLRLELPTASHRVNLWREQLAASLRENPDLERDIDALAFRYGLTHSAIETISKQAAIDASVEKTPLSLSHIEGALRLQIEHNMHSLASPFSTRMTWDDLVLAERTRARLDEMVTYVRNVRRVYEDWGFGRISPKGRGLTALFSGPPGTGKTISAAIIAREIGAQLYRVDLSRVVDKYIGETEKNLAAIFDEAGRSGAVLLFDEADSLFAKRTHVKSSNDRYANLEVNFLLQRMEDFDGTSILTTNLTTEVDSAFQRRIKFKLTFEMPNAQQRAMLFQTMMPREAPLAAAVDWEALAEHELSPGHIKNAILRAAFRAAQSKSSIDHDLLHASVLEEYRELGMLVRDT